MDDFIILLKTKEECIEVKKQIEIFLQKNLKLELNAKSRYYPYKMGVNFCGYRIFTTHKLLRTSSKKKIKNNVKKWNKLHEEKKLDIQCTMQSLNSWLGHSSHCNSYKLQQKIINSCNFLVNNDFYAKQEQRSIKPGLIDRYSIFSDFRNTLLKQKYCLCVYDIRTTAYTKGIKLL